MQGFRLFLFLSLLAPSGFAYQDYDIDGVEDAFDRCPDTPFDAYVDAYGCTLHPSYYGVLTLKVGSDISVDDTYSQTNSLSFFLNYRYYNWDLSISNNNYNLLNAMDRVSDSRDLYIDAGYIFHFNQWDLKLGIGTKQATEEIDENADVYAGTGENDYSVSLYSSYFVSQRQNLFVYYGHTFSGDSDTVDYRDRDSLSLGGGYVPTERWYTALAYEYSTSVYEGAEATQALSWFNSYNLSERFFMTFNIAQGLNSDAYDQVYSFQIGAVIK